MIQMLQRALDPRVAPAGVLLGHPDNQLADLLHHTRTTDSLPRIRPLCGDELAVPRQDCVRSYDGSDLPQDLPAKRFPFGSQPAALVIGNMESLPAKLELFFEDAVLLDHLCDQLRLMTGNPAGERSQEEMKMDGFNHAASVSDVRQVVAPQPVSIFGHYGPDFLLSSPDS